MSSARSTYPSCRVVYFIFLFFPISTHQKVEGDREEDGNVSLYTVTTQRTRFTSVELFMFLFSVNFDSSCDDFLLLLFKLHWATPID